jgi:hypothetical protein
MAAEARLTRRFASLSSALVSGLDLRLLLLWVLGTLAPALIAALPIWRSLVSALDLSPLSPAVARHFDALVFEDLTSRFQVLRPTHEGVLSVAVACFVLLSPLLTAAMLAIAEGGPSTGFVSLLQSALAWYGRSFRLWLCSLVPVAALVGIASWLSKTASSYGERATLESNATWAGRLALAGILILAALLHVTVEAARAELVTSPLRRSVLGAWRAGVRKALAQPLATLALYFAPSLFSLGLAALLLAIRVRLSGASFIALASGTVVTQLAVASIGWGRVSRLIALSRLFRARVENE